MTSSSNSIVIAPVARRARLSDHVVETLSRLIIEGTLEPGAVIRTEELAVQLGVSRTPMRESLQKLEADGFVTIAPNGIARVATLGVDEAMEMMDVREVIDGLVARLLAERGLNESTANDLAALARQMKESSHNDDKHKYLALNARFHLMMLVATQHKPLQQFMPLIRITSQAIYMRHGRQRTRHQQSSKEHFDILEAIKAKDGVLAEKLARGHIRNAADFWLKKLTKSS
jgi:GntR family transcriptional regulator, vanillate catabolism transcriptional regulator